MNSNLEFSKLDQFPAWFSKAKQILSDVITNPSYPCYFGSQTEKAGVNSFTFLNRDLDDENIDGLAVTLSNYISHASIGPNQRSLILFVGPPVDDPNLIDDCNLLWSILEKVSSIDTHPWPSSVPISANDPDWQWCFGGKKWFILGCSPAYKHRRSRNLGPCLTIVFQLSERVFINLSGDSNEGMKAKKNVRKRLKLYDSSTIHPHIGSDSKSSKYKWRQYFLPDDDTVLDTSECPFTLNKERNINE